MDRKILDSTTLKVMLVVIFSFILMGIGVPAIVRSFGNGDEFPKPRAHSTSRIKRCKPHNMSQILEEEFADVYYSKGCGNCIIPEYIDIETGLVKKNLTEEIVTDYKNDNKTTGPWTGIDDDDAVAMLEASQKMGLRFVNRLQWGAKSPKFQSQKNDYPAKFVVLTDDPNEEMCNTTQTCMDQIRRAQMQDMQTYYLSDIANNFIISSEGLVYVGRGWKKMGKMPLRFEKTASKCIYIKFLGKFPSENSPKEAVLALENLLKFGVEQNKISRNYTTIVTRVNQFVEGY